MSLIPNTVCRRCHREYPSIRSSCPYCGTKKAREVRRTLPESDSAVKGTAAARQAAQDTNWQLIIGGVLLLLVLAAVISIVSVGVSNHVSDTEVIAKAEDVPQIAAETTAVPAPTPTPTPSPTPTPAVTSITITLAGGGSLPDGFMEERGSVIYLEATCYPITEGVTVAWSSTNENCATVDQDGVVTITGGYGTSCDIVASVGAVEARCPVWGND